MLHQKIAPGMAHHLAFLHAQHIEERPVGRHDHMIPDTHRIGARMRRRQQQFFTVLRESSQPLLGFGQGFAKLSISLTPLLGTCSLLQLLSEQGFGARPSTRRANAPEKLFMENRNKPPTSPQAEDQLRKHINRGLKPRHLNLPNARTALEHGNKRIQRIVIQMVNSAEPLHAIHAGSGEEPTFTPVCNNFSKLLLGCLTP